ncbi:MAG: BamA/TamA family outer membrane protein [Dysgonomonas sp.]
MSSEKSKYRIYIHRYIITVCIIFITSCSTTKYVPEGEYLLSSVSIKTDNNKISTLDLEPYIKQKANFKTFEIFRLPLYVYNLSGRDTTKWYNKILKNGGEPPVIYDSAMVDKSVKELEQNLLNIGYPRATVTPQVIYNKNKVKVKYLIKTGEPYIINDYSINLPDSVFQEEMYSDSNFVVLNNKSNIKDSVVNINNFLKLNTLIKPKSIFNPNVLDEERGRITSVFKNSGFYQFNKAYIGFIADTTLSNNKVDLELTILPRMLKTPDQKIIETPHLQYSVKDIFIYVDYDPLTDNDLSKYQSSEVFSGEGYSVIYGKRGKYIKPEVILNNCYILPGTLYNENTANLTYTTLSQLQILKNVNISFVETDSLQLNCIITCVPDKKQGFSAEVEGTNSAGYFGIGAGLGYLHRNIFKGSEQFNIKLHGAYEAITPNFSNFDKNYFEAGGETSLTFPRFINPFLTYSLKRRLHASTQITTNYSFQRRPDFFTRTILSGGIKYIWNARKSNSIKHSLDLLDISYVHLPYTNKSFLDSLTNEARIYSFQDQFIVSAGYTYYNSNYNPLVKNPTRIQTIRASVETAGNALALIAAASGIKNDADGSKKILNTTFSQYVRGTIDFSRTLQLDEKNSFAWRLGGGIAYPYGNSKLIPIQKRFFSGGANSVRGWGIRELGPGSYYSPDANFYFHSGDIRFDANAEYRSKIFWIIELAAFVDAGNIWTVKEYKGQEGGSFKIDSFYKQIASSLGFGLRLDFNFVLIRLDCGWKIYDPANRYTIDSLGAKVYESSKSHWPILKPFDVKKNTAWHIAVGYPF